MKKIIGTFLFAFASLISLGQTCNETWKMDMSQQQISPGQNVVFTYTGLSNAGATLTIDFGDGTIQNYILGAPPIAFPAHTYAQAGIYNVKFTLSGTCNQIKSSQIVVSTGTCTPTTGATGHTIICLDSPYTFEIATLAQPGWNVTDIIWNMGDGNFISSAFTSLNYIYNTTGLYYRSVAVHLYNPTLNEHCYYLVYLTDSNTNTDYYEFSSQVVFGSASFIMTPSNPSPGDNVTFTYTGSTSATTTANSWYYSFTVGSYTSPPFSLVPATGSILHTITNIDSGSYCADLSIFLRDPTGNYCAQANQICFDVPSVPCDTCNSFKPNVGERYWMSAWVKVDELMQVKSYNPTNIANGLNLNTSLIDDVFIELEFSGSGISAQFFPTGEIIDGWQRVVGEFTIPLSAYDLVINLNADAFRDTFFDDIRIHPFNSSMKSYVYDGETFWLVSELDDNNYATFYEYDQEGGLIRIKKETARGVVTIQETRSNTIKANP